MTKRVVRIVGGFASLAIGGVLLVLPGPGWAMIAVGLALLSSEYPWARRLLDRLKKTWSAVKSRAFGRPGGRSA